MKLIQEVRKVLIEVLSLQERVDTEDLR